VARAPRTDPLARSALFFIAEVLPEFFTSVVDSCRAGTSAKAAGDEAADLDDEDLGPNMRTNPMFMPRVQQSESSLATTKALEEEMERTATQLTEAEKANAGLRLQLKNEKIQAQVNETARGAAKLDTVESHYAERKEFAQKRLAGALGVSLGPGADGAVAVEHTPHQRARGRNRRKTQEGGALGNEEE